MVSQQGFAPYANGNFPASPDDNQAVNRKNYWNFQNAPDEYSPADSSNNYVTQNGKNLTDPQPHIVHPVNSSSSELPRASHVTSGDPSDVMMSPVKNGNCCQFCEAAEVVTAKRENSTLKNVLLFIIVSVSFGMLILTCEQVLREYLGEPFAVETTLVNETDINRKFPDVIICSHRMASLQKLRQHLNFSTQIEDLAQDVIEKIQKGEEVDQDIFSREGIDLETHYNNILWHSSVVSFLPIQDLRAVKISRDEFVIDCKIKNYIPGGPAFIDCLPFMEDFVSNEFGVCQRIKLPEKQKEAAAKFPGAVYGMKLNLFMNTKDTSGQLTSSTGVRVTVFDPEFPKIPQNNGIDISPGTALSIAFNRVEYQKRSRTARLNKSHRFECVDSRDWGKYLLKTSDKDKSIRGTEYATASEMLCDQTCASILLQELCNCSTMHFFGDDICSPGTNREHGKCVRSNMEYLKESHQQCAREMCKPSCKNVEFEVKTNQAMFPSDQFLPIFINQIIANSSDSSPFIKQHVRELVRDTKLTADNFDELRQEFVHLHFYSASSDTLHIEEKSIYTFWSLLSNIGGNMGMFLGLSLVGFFKVVIRLKNRLKAAFKLCLSGRRKRRSNNNSPMRATIPRSSTANSRC